MRQIFIDDRYLLGNLLGVGGMARVFLARDRHLNRKVALKLLRDQYAENQEFVERFRREAQSAAALNHPNIVSVYDWGRSQNATYYMAMECVPGGTLKERIASEGPLSMGTAAALGIQVAKALEIAHECGVVHRDVKPQNILLDSSGQAKVADFGIARAVGAMATTAISQTGLVMGTVNYVSPEQAMSEPVGPQSDLYSLGVVLYEMLTTKVPFEAETLIGVCMKHVNEPPRPPKELNPGVSEGMEAIVLKLLAKKPDDRYGSAADLVDDLRRVGNGLAPLTAKPVEIDPRVIQTNMQPTVPISSGNTVRNAVARRRRNRTRASGVLAAGIVLLTLLGGSDWSLSQNLLRQAFGPSTQSEAPQVQEEEAQQGTNSEAASSTEGTAQAEEATNISPKGTDSSSEQSPSTEIAVSPVLASAPVANTSNLGAEPVLWSSPAQQPSQPTPEQQPAKEKPAKEKPAKEKPAKAQPAKVQAVASQVRSYGGSSNTQDGGRTKKPWFTEQISDSQKPPHK